jgi:hypothetical protein
MRANADADPKMHVTLSVAKDGETSSHMLIVDHAAQRICYDEEHSRNITVGESDLCVRPRSVMLIEAL